MSESTAGELERQHGDGCQCVRCTGFQPANRLGLRHGAYSSLAISDRARLLADELRAVVPTYGPADEVSVRLLAITLARIERATAALEAADAASDGRELAVYTGDAAEPLRWLRHDLRSWVTSAGRLADSLGLTPTSRAKLGLDVARTGDALAEYLAEHYPAEGEP